MVTLVGRVRFIQALQSRSFALLWLGQTISVLGDGASDIALAWQILLLTGSGTAMGIVLTARMVPNQVFLLIGGAAADHLPRRFVLLWSDAGLLGAKCMVPVGYVLGGVLTDRVGHSWVFIAGGGSTGCAGYPYAGIRERELC